MINNRHFDSDVLIVGAGPTGVSLACGLRRFGIQTLVIDKEAPVGQARAMGLSARTLEVFRAYGVLDDVLGEAVVYRTMDMYANRRRILHMTFDVSDLSSPNPFGAVLPQNRVVALLEKHLSMNGGSVTRPVSLQSLEQDDDGVTVTLNENGSPRVVRVRYVVGCDGAHSKVREALGLKFDGSDYEDRLLAADLFVDWDLASNGGHIFLGASGTITALPFPEAGKWRVAVFGGNDNKDRSPEAVMARLRNVMKDSGPKNAHLHDPVHTTCYGIHRRFAHQFRLGRCFVAGDAAHIHSPGGGQGMNTGIQDGFNLAWKLALVLKGSAGDKLLDTYQDERHPVAEQILKTTDRLTQIILPRSALKRALRNATVQLLGSVSPMGSKVGRALSQLDIKYSNSHIVSEGKKSSEANEGHQSAFDRAPAAGERAPDVTIDRRSSDKVARLFDLIYRNDTCHTLLVFDGLTPTNTDEVLSRIVDVIGRDYAGRVIAHRISWPGYRATQVLANESRFLDPDGSIHTIYGAVGACLYLVRPDGYIGYRSHPPVVDDLVSYLHRVFST